MHLYEITDKGRLLKWIDFGAEVQFRMCQSCPGYAADCKFNPMCLGLVLHNKDSCKYQALLNAPADFVKQTVMRIFAHMHTLAGLHSVIFGTNVDQIMRGLLPKYPTVQEDLANAHIFEQA